MSKCCDRCKKPIDPLQMITIKFVLNFLEFIRNIEVAIVRKRLGENDPSYYHKTARGKWELCGDCTEKLCEFLEGDDVQC